MAGDLGVADHVLFRGVLDNAATRRAIGSCTLLLVPSRTREGFGLVAAEAALAGTPCIASRVGGLPEVVEDNVTGRLVAENDAEALADAAASLLQDPREWQRCSDNALQRGFSLQERPAVARRIRSGALLAGTHRCARRRGRPLSAFLEWGMQEGRSGDTGRSTRRQPPARDLFDLIGMALRQRPLLKRWKARATDPASAFEMFAQERAALLRIGGFPLLRYKLSGVK